MAHVYFSIIVLYFSIIVANVDFHCVFALVCTIKIDMHN